MGCPSTSSGNFNSTKQVTGRNSKVRSVILCGDGTNAASVSVYDGTSTSGVLICTLRVTASAPSASFDSSEGVECSQGIFASASGTGVSAVVHYELE